MLFSLPDFTFLQGTISDQTGAFNIKSNETKGVLPISSVGYSTILLPEGGNLAASKIRNLECPSYEICLIDYGCGKFNRKIHIMEQYP